MPQDSIQLIVGLGNPGSRYEGTRHNVGFLVVDSFIRPLGASWNPSSLGLGLVAQISPSNHPIRVVKPHTHMNASGDFVGALARFYHISSAGILVVSDDLDLPLGRIRIRASGSSGGQRGLDSVLTALSTQDVPRMRLGIGPCPQGIDPTDFVLARFEPQELRKLDKMVERAAEALQVICRRGLAPAMNVYNAFLEES